MVNQRPMPVWVAEPGLCGLGAVPPETIMPDPSKLETAMTGGRWLALAAGALLLYTVFSRR